MGVRVDLYRNDNKVVIDAFDRLVVNVFMEKERHQHKSFLICGCDAGAGSTSIAVELAISLSVSGWKTILVDADLRKESKYKRLNQRTKAGLSDYVNLHKPKDLIINSTNWNGLDYISCGRDDSETPVKILCSQKIRELQAELCRDYDFVIYDVPALNSAVDATIMGVEVDCTYLVVAAEQTSFRNLTAAREQLEGTGANLAGIIVNKVSEDEYSRYANDYNYFIQKEYVSRNPYYKSRTGESKKKTVFSKLKKWMGCFLFFCLLSCGMGGKMVSAEESSYPVETASMLPTLFVTEYKIEDGIPAVGEDFTLEVTVENMNRYVAAHQVSMTLYLKSEGMYLQQGEINQRYIEYFAPGQKKVFEFQLATSEQMQVQAGMIDIQFDYVNQNGDIGTNTTTISPKLRKNCKLELLSISTAETATTGAKALFNIRYKNSGETEVRNVKMRIEGNIKNNGREIDLDAPEPGQQEYLDQYVIFTETGNQVLDVQLTYEDAAGIVYELESQKVSTLVMENSLARETENKEENESDVVTVGVEKEHPQNIGIMILLAVAVIVILAVVILKKQFNRKKKES